MGTGRLGQGWHSCPGTDPLEQPQALLWVHCDLGAALQTPAAQHCLTLHLPQSLGDIRAIVLPQLLWPTPAPHTALHGQTRVTTTPAEPPLPQHFMAVMEPPKSTMTREGCAGGAEGLGIPEPHPYCIPEPHSPCPPLPLHP